MTAPRVVIPISLEIKKNNELRCFLRESEDCDFQCVIKYTNRSPLNFKTIVINKFDYRK